MLGGPFLDVNADGKLSAVDVLVVVNRINSGLAAMAEGEAWNGYAAAGATPSRCRGTADLGRNRRVSGRGQPGCRQRRSLFTACRDSGGRR